MPLGEKTLFINLLLHFLAESNLTNKGMNISVGEISPSLKNTGCGMLAA